MRIFLKTNDEISLMREAGHLVGQTLAEVGKHIKPGVTTLHLDTIAGEFIRSHHAVPSLSVLVNPYGESFPGSICTSVNHVDSSGVPCAACVLHEGDLVSIECGALLDGFHGAGCYTFCVGEVSDILRGLCNNARQGLDYAVREVVIGHHPYEIRQALESYADAHGLHLLCESRIHGIGKEWVEGPEYSHAVRANRRVMLKEGICLVVDCSFSLGSRELVRWNRQCGMTASGQSPVARFAQTVVVTKSLAEVLSSFEEIEHS